MAQPPIRSPRPRPRPVAPDFDPHGPAQQWRRMSPPPSSQASGPGRVSVTDPKNHQVKGRLGMRYQCASTPVPVPWPTRGPRRSAGSAIATAEHGRIRCHQSLQGECPEGSLVGQLLASGSESVRIPGVWAERLLVGRQADVGFVRDGRRRVCRNRTKMA